MKLFRFHFLSYSTFWDEYFLAMFVLTISYELLNIILQFEILINVESLPKIRVRVCSPVCADVSARITAERCDPRSVNGGC